MHQPRKDYARLSSLRSVRKARGMSLDQLSALSEIHKSTISRLENGLTHAEPRTVRDLAWALRVKPEELMQEQAEDEQAEEGALLVS
jgi:transcriptional regulator with XRE-family HTH domain